MILIDNYKGADPSKAKTVPIFKRGYDGKEKIVSDSYNYNPEKAIFCY
jgi:hypothetical protein